MTRSYPEHTQQVRFLALLAYEAPIVRSCIFSVPSGGRRDLKEAVRLKAEGLCAGVPDLFLAIPVEPYHGIFLEFKAATGSLSLAQRTWHTRLSSLGYQVAVPRSAEEGIRIVKDYLSEKKKAGMGEPSDRPLPNPTTD